MKKCSSILALLLTLTPLFAQLPQGVVNTQNPDDQPPAAAESLARISVPDGFHVSLFAAEPDVAQPIAINFDDRGRLWVAESFSYIEWKRNGRDRILIFEDSDNDGEFDKRTVFWDQGNHVSGFQIGFGGVWVCDAPNLLFIPDADGDDAPDAEPRIVLDGWTTEAEHNFFNGLTWGPDGWLYGRHGIKKPSFVGKPETPADKRTALSCSIWRYHPIHKTFEIYAEGTINPWGLDWNAEGQAFISTSVVDHLWHLVPGARFARWEGQGTSIHPHSYDLMEPASDHRHWQGGETERRQADVHDDAGGGHSHCGLMIYQSEAWPEPYRGRAFLGNVLGHRINMDHLTRRNSGYVASHGDDFLLGGSDWFRATDLKQGPHGEMMVAEWTDFGECHDRDGVHRTSGRLYRVWHGDSPAAQEIDVAAMKTESLLGLLTHENVWWRRRALRNLYERAWTGEQITPAQTQRLLETAKAGSTRDAVTAAQALHALNPGGDWMEAVYENNSGPDRDAMRAQIIGFEFVSEIPTRERIAWLGAQIPSETSPLVHLWMAAALQRIPVEYRWPAATALAEIEVSPDDRNLALMRWYGIEPLVALDPNRAINLALTDGHPYLSQAIARRAVSVDGLTLVVSAIRQSPNSEAAVGPMLEGLLAALPARVEMPNGWSELSAILRNHEDESIRRSAFRLAHRFGDPAAEKAMVTRVIDADASTSERIELIRLLVSSRSKSLAPHLPDLLLDTELGVEAIRAVAVFPQPESAQQLLALLDSGNLAPASRNAILETLASRADFAGALVNAFQAGSIERGEIPAYLARQIAAVASDGDAFAKVWGLNSDDVKAKDKLLAKWKQRLTEESLADAKPAEGRHVFQRHCGVCHRLYGEGGEIGPDLTGSDRANLDYFLINVLFPSEDVSEDYKLVTLTLTDDRVLTGNIAEENANVVTFRQVGQVSRIDTTDIASRHVADISLMPQGLLDNLRREDVRDLIGYLRTSQPLK